MIPGLENAEFLRYGVMHRNTYLQSPDKLDSLYSLKKAPNVYFAGQMTGVEGYVESAGSGLVAGISAARKAKGEPEVRFPKTTMLGAMAEYVAHGGASSFAPMNANFGIIEPLGYRVKGGKVAKNEKLAERGCSEQVIEKVAQYRAEARFLRALMPLRLSREPPYLHQGRPQ